MATVERTHHRRPGISTYLCGVSMHTNLVCDTQILTTLILLGWPLLCVTLAKFTDLGAITGTMAGELHHRKSLTLHLTFVFKRQVYMR